MDLLCVYVCVYSSSDFVLRVLTHAHLWWLESAKMSKTDCHHSGYRFFVFEKKRQKIKLVRFRSKNRSVWSIWSTALSERVLDGLRLRSVKLRCCGSELDVQNVTVPLVIVFAVGKLVFDITRSFILEKAAALAK